MKFKLVEDIDLNYYIDGDDIRISVPLKDFINEIHKNYSLKDLIEIIEDHDINEPDLYSNEYDDKEKLKMVDDILYDYDIVDEFAENDEQLLDAWLENAEEQHEYSRMSDWDYNGASPKDFV